MNGVFQQLQQSARSVIAEITTRTDTHGEINISQVARAVYEVCAEGRFIPVRIEWAALEQYKQIARAELRAKFGHESDENEAYQDDMFSGHLQKFYPVKSGPDADAVYKRLELLTDDEIEQNIASLRQQAQSRLRHCDALRAFKISREQ